MLQYLLKKQKTTNIYKWTHAIHTCVFQGPAVHKALETPFKILHLLFSTLSIELNKKPKPQYLAWHFFLSATDDFAA